METVNISAEPPRSVAEFLWEQHVAAILSGRQPMSGGERVIAAMKMLPPLTDEEAAMIDNIDKVIQQAREDSLADHLSA